MFCDHFTSEPELRFLTANDFDAVKLIGKFGALGLDVWSRPVSAGDSTCLYRQVPQRLLIYVDAPNDPAVVERILQSWLERADPVPMLAVSQEELEPHPVEAFGRLSAALSMRGVARELESS